MHRSTVAGVAATVLHLPPAARRRLGELVAAGYPNESCGLLVGRLDGDGVAVERVATARNLSTERARDRYLLDPDDFLAADRTARAAGLEVVGIWHSHPDHPARPSVTDLEAAWEGYSYLIIAVTAAGAGDFRSYRLVDGRFREETIQEDPRP